jgi:hypothetical protein
MMRTRIQHRTAERGAAMISIYDGRSCVGFVLARGRAGFEAFDAGERSLGVFETQNAAINKIQATTN